MSVRRRLPANFWTSERDRKLQSLRAASLPATKIAARLGTAPYAVYRRLSHLRGVVWPSRERAKKELRAKSAKLRKEKARRTEAAIRGMRAAIARGVPRNEAIIQAKKQGARPQAIANELGLHRQSIYRVTVLEALTEQELRARRKHRKESARREGTAITALRAAIARGMPRDTAILQARKAGATYVAIAKELALTRQRVHQIILLHE
jgi:IS30 family transposase